MRTKVGGGKLFLFLFRRRTCPHFPKYIRSNPSLPFLRPRKMWHWVQAHTHNCKVIFFSSASVLRLLLCDSLMQFRLSHVNLTFRTAPTNGREGGNGGQKIPFFLPGCYSPISLPLVPSIYSKTPLDTARVATDDRRTEIRVADMGEYGI